jgi:hypothetical protein
MATVRLVAVPRARRRFGIRLAAHARPSSGGGSTSVAAARARTPTGTDRASPVTAGRGAWALWRALDAVLVTAGAGSLMEAHVAAWQAAGDTPRAFVASVARAHGLRLAGGAGDRAAAALAGGNARAFAEAMGAAMTSDDYARMVHLILSMLLGAARVELPEAMCQACSVACGPARAAEFKSRRVKFPAGLRQAVTAAGTVMDRVLRSHDTTLAAELFRVVSYWAGYGVDAKLLGVQNESRWQGNGATALRVGRPLARLAGSGVRQRLLDLLLAYVINGVLFHDKKTAELKYNIAAIENTLFGARFARVTNAFLRGKDDDLWTIDVVPVLAELAGHFAEQGSWLTLTVQHRVPACGVCKQQPGYSRCRTAWAPADGSSSASAAGERRRRQGSRNNQNQKTPAAAVKNLRSHPISLRGPRDPRLGVVHPPLKRRGQKKKSRPRMRTR